MKGVIIAVFLGGVGGYQFYQGNTKRGILYLFTGGLFAIGWILDIIDACKNCRLPSPPKKTYETTDQEIEVEPPPIATPTVQEMDIVTLKVNVTMQDGRIEEMSEDKILTDGTCLVSDGGKHYHTHVGCCYKWNSEALRRFNERGGWKLTTIDNAKKQGLVFCLICNEEEKENERFWDNLDKEWDDLSKEWDDLYKEL